MPENPRFSVRDTAEGLKELNDAIKILGYKDGADWYRDMKRQTIKKAEKKIQKA